MMAQWTCPADVPLASDVRGPDVGASLKVQGASCTSGTECANGQCSDGVCCDKLCSGCSACTQALTRQPDGTCAPVLNGIDPHEICGMICSGGSLTTMACNGSATCSAISSTLCPGNVLCASGSACLAPTCASDSNCASGFRCSGTSCVPKSTLGSACATNSECTGGSCVDGHCCGSTSCPSCQSCTGAGGTCAPNAASNGTLCGASMYCYNGSCASCVSGNPCNTGNTRENGVISCATGQSVCAHSSYKPENTSCGNPASCVNGASSGTAFSGDTCDGLGVCLSGWPTTCDHGCSGTTCSPGLENGQTCTFRQQCVSNICGGSPGATTCQDSCGSVGDYCCVNEGCPSSGACDNPTGRCVVCGDQDTRCCMSSICFNGLNVCVTVDDMCRRCGQLGDVCCAGNTCIAPGTCSTSAGRCIAPPP